MTAFAKIEKPFPITDDERARRKLAVEHAYANNAIEGIGVDKEAAPIFDRFVNGEISLEELGQRIRSTRKIV